MRHQKHFCMVLVLLHTIWINAEKIMRPKMKDMKIWSDNIYVTHSVTYDGHEPRLNLSMNALKTLQDVDIHFEGNFMQKQDPNYFLSFNTTMNLCRLINWRNLSPIGTFLHNYMKEYGNLIENCPIAKGKYYIHNFWISEDSASATLPEMDFNILFSAFHLDSNGKRTLIANDQFIGEAVVQDVNNINRGIFAMLPKGR